MTKLRRLALGGTIASITDLDEQTSSHTPRSGSSGECRGLRGLVFARRLVRGRTRLPVPASKASVRRHGEGLPRGRAFAFVSVVA